MEHSRNPYLALCIAGELELERDLFRDYWVGDWCDYSQCLYIDYLYCGECQDQRGFLKASLVIG